MTTVIFDIDGVVRDVGGSYRRALADTVEHFTQGSYRPSPEEIDRLKSEGIWNNDWEASQELIQRHFTAQKLAAQKLEFPSQNIDPNLDQNPASYREIVQFFQSRYRGTDPENWDGYICSEPLLVEPEYFENLTRSQIKWGFFSGATRASAEFVLQRRLGLVSPVLVAMEDAPGKPDPAGLWQTLEQLHPEMTEPIIYVGDTVADMYTVNNARQQQSTRTLLGVGVLPPHVQEVPEISQAYTETLKAAGALFVLTNMQELTPELIENLGKPSNLPSNKA
jgi:HAD superfamily phosphatase